MSRSLRIMVFELNPFGIMKVKIPKSELCYIQAAIKVTRYIFYLFFTRYTYYPLTRPFQQFHNPLQYKYTDSSSIQIHRFPFHPQTLPNSSNSLFHSFHNQSGNWVVLKRCKSLLCLSTVKCTRSFSVIYDSEVVL